MTIDAPDWFTAREFAARRFGVDPFDPGMFATPAAESAALLGPAVSDDELPDTEPAPKTRRRRA